MLCSLFAEHVRVPSALEATQPNDATVPATYGHQPDADEATTGQQLPGPGVLKDLNSMYKLLDILFWTNRTKYLLGVSTSAVGWDGG